MKKVLLIILILGLGFSMGWFLKGLFISTETIKYQDELYQQIDDLVERKIKDSLSKKIEPNNKERFIKNPLNVEKLELINHLDFTSGGSPEKKNFQSCFNNQKGFYGRYHLIDKTSKLLPVIKGHIDIFKEGQLGNWNANDKNQEVFKINLKTNLVVVWDSIKIGLHKKQIEQFSKVNYGLCTTLNDSIYFCDFNNFSATFNFDSDTLKELTIIRNCDK